MAPLSHAGGAIWAARATFLENCLCLGSLLSSQNLPSTLPLPQQKEKEGLPPPSILLTGKSGCREAGADLAWE